MAIKLDYTSHPLEFKKPAGTSRGILKTKDTWFLKLYEEEDISVCGYGEVSMLPGLSVDFGIDVASELDKLRIVLTKYPRPTIESEVYAWVNKHISPGLPAVRFAFETAWLDLINGGCKLIFDNSFYKDSTPLPINGLIWMAPIDVMREELDAKVHAGFDCIKIKVGALDFDEELGLLRYLRENYPVDKVTLRLDANGAFLTNEVLIKLKKLAPLNIHSIEQPIRPKQPEAMSLICEKSQIPIALDEELIGIQGYTHKKALLEELKPQYIILKPSLLGGFHSTSEWIDIADDLGIGWWITSALESNIGLNAICQFTAKQQVTLPQGLGTGQLFTNNIPSPLTVKAGEIWYRNDGHWDLSEVGHWS